MGTQRNKVVFAVLPTAVTTLVAEGENISNLQSGQLGFFDADTSLAFDEGTAVIPKNILIALGKDIVDEEEEFVHYLENISSEVSFKKWYFGHLHLDEEVDDNICLYDKIIEIE